MTEGAVLTRFTRALYFKKCEACEFRFSTIFRNAKCPRCSARSKVYGIQELDTPTTNEGRVPGADSEDSS